MAKIILPAALRRRMEQPTPEVEIPAGTVGEALDQLIRRHPELRDALLDSDGRVRPVLRIFIDERAIPTATAQAEPLGEADRMLILPPIAGG